MQTPVSYASMPGLANSLCLMHAGAATTVTGSAGFPSPVRGTAKSHELQLEGSPNARHTRNYHGILLVVYLTSDHLRGWRSAVIWETWVLVSIAN